MTSLRTETGARTYYCKDLHAKIFATDLIAYIGSANFTPASAKSMECGVLTKSETDIHRLKESFFPEIISRSTEYFDEFVSKYLLLTSVFIGELEVILGATQGCLSLSKREQDDYWEDCSDFDICLLKELDGIAEGLRELSSEMLSHESLKKNVNKLNAVLFSSDRYTENSQLLAVAEYDQKCAIFNSVYCGIHETDDTDEILGTSQASAEEKFLQLVDDADDLFQNLYSDVLTVRNVLKTIKKELEDIEFNNALNMR